MKLAADKHNPYVANAIKMYHFEAWNNLHMSSFLAHGSSRNYFWSRPPSPPPPVSHLKLVVNWFFSSRRFLQLAHSPRLPGPQAPYSGSAGLNSMFSVISPRLLMPSFVIQHKVFLMLFLPSFGIRYMIFINFESIPKWPFDKFFSIKIPEYSFQSKIQTLNPQLGKSMTIMSFQ